MSKGKLVYVDGSIRKSDYEKDGVKQYYVETVARDVKFLSPKSENGSGSSPDTSFDVDDFADV
jgi:single-stranded DNA-binding protein